MDPSLMLLITRGSSSRAKGASYGTGSSDSGDGAAKAIVLGLLAVMAAFGIWKAYEAMQWTTVSTSNVLVRVVRSDGGRNFTPTLVDDFSGTVFRQRIGPKRCHRGPPAMPVGSTVLASVDKQIDRRDGSVRYVLDTADLGRRYC